MPEDFSESNIGGFDVFVYEGQRRFRCPCCKYDAIDLDTIKRHMRGLHGHHPLAVMEKRRDPRPEPGAAPVKLPDGSVEQPPQMEHGYEIFFVQGQKRYRCPELWESGARCMFDTYDLEYLKRHVAGPHTRDGKPRPKRRVEVSPILDAEGNPITREYREPELPAEFENVTFKK